MMVATSGMAEAKDTGEGPFVRGGVAGSEPERVSGVGSSPSASGFSVLCSTSGD